MGERQFTLDVYRGIKATTRAWLVRAFGHGFQKVAAGYSRATQQSISGYCDRNELGEGFIAVDVLIDLVKATGSTELLQLLADVCGYRVVPRHPRAATGEPLGRIAGAGRLCPTWNVLLGSPCSRPPSWRCRRPWRTPSGSTR
jgi:hypothetical protein